MTIQAAVGVTIETGAQDWQIFQQASAGVADIRLTGAWRTESPHETVQVVVRLVREDTGGAVRRSLEWAQAQMLAEGRWTHTLAGVPRGGLYRIETGLQLNGGPVEWAQRGDTVHHVGVGDVWVITGQSNAAGYGRNPTDDGPELGVHLFQARGSWALAAHPLADSTRTRYPVNREFANGAHSPFLHFGRILKRELGCPIGLIPAALGGSALSQWLRRQDGSLFRNMLDYIRDAGGRCRGVLWYQGESDADAEKGATYLARFTELVADFRAELGDPALPVITAQLNRLTGQGAPPPGGPGWDLVREAQRQAARTIPGVHAISTLDLGLSDLIHNGADANRVIGERMASVVLGAVCGRDVKHRHPDLAAARLRDGRWVELTFAEVDGRLDFANWVPGQIPFAVRDAEGEVPVTAWRIEAPNRFLLELGRALVADAIVIGAPGACPPFQVPFDLAGYRPMLGFTAAVATS